jgi:hypothetical protein
MDGNKGGVLIAGCTRGLSERNVIRDNVISNSPKLNGVVGFWCGAQGSGNVVETNCLWSNLPKNLDVIGFTAANNVIAEPRFVDEAAKDFRLTSASPCRGKGPAALLPRPA